MHLKNQRPIFCPEHLFGTLDAMSKAALMDLCWVAAGGADMNADQAHTATRLKAMAVNVVEERKAAIKAIKSIKAIQGNQVEGGK